MADQIATGYASSGGNASGVGAVIFNEPISPLEQLDKNMDALEKGQKERDAQQDNFLKLSAKMMGGFNPNLNGIRPFDRDYITQQSAAVQKNMVSALATGMNPHNPASGSAFIDAENSKTRLSGDISTSRSWNTMAVNAIKEYQLHPDKYDGDVFTKGLATLMGTDLGTLNAHPEKYSNILVDKKPDLDIAIDDYIKKTYPSGLETTRPAKEEDFNRLNAKPDAGRVYESEIKQNISDDGINYFVATSRQQPNLRAIIDNNWQKLKTNSPDVVQSYMNKYLADGASKEEAEYKGQSDYLFGMMKHHQSTIFDKIVDKGATEAEKNYRAGLRATEMKPSDYNQFDAEIAANFNNGRPGYDNALKQFKLDPYTTYEEKKRDDPNNPGTQITSIEPRNHENNILSVKKEQDGGYSLVTSKTLADAQGQNQGEVAGIYPKEATLKFPTINALYSYIANKGGGQGADWLRKIDNYFDKMGAKNADGTWNTEKLVPSSTWKKQAPPAQGGNNSTQSTDRATKAKDVLTGLGKKTDDASIQLFLKNNPDFK